MLLVIVSVAALSGMLFVFQRVVQQQTNDGERRRAAMSAYAVAAARCNALPRLSDRVACRAELPPLPRDNASLTRGEPAPR